MKTLYTILDIVSNESGPLMPFRHDAAAIRFYGDLHADPRKTGHAKDHDLIAVGDIDEDTHTITGLLLPKTIITGKQWLASQTPPTDQQTPLRVVNER